MKNICLLGATGSIGSQVLEIIKDNEEFSLKAFSFGENITRAITIIEEFKPELVSSSNRIHCEELRRLYPNITITYDICEVAKFETSNPVVINALTGAVGLKPSVTTLENGRDLLLANKESLVMAGPILLDLANKNHVKIIPIDSEHSAIFQIINFSNHQVKKVVLTASGGPFRNTSLNSLTNVTKEEVLKHPTWQMGPKITTDCATMMNKGFEIVEAYYLFNLKIDQIEVLIHPQSIIHGLVEFEDHSVIAQMSVPDMRIPIMYALNYPDHKINNLSTSLDLTKVASLEFEMVDNERFPLIEMTIKAIKDGKFGLVILNAINEALVLLFLDNKIKFSEIVTNILKFYEQFKHDFDEWDYTLDNIIRVNNFIIKEVTHVV